MIKNRILQKLCLFLFGRCSCDHVVVSEAFVVSFNYLLIGFVFLCDGESFVSLNVITMLERSHLDLDGSLVFVA